MKYLLTISIIIFIGCSDIKDKPRTVAGRDSVSEKKSGHVPASISFPSTKRDSTGKLQLQAFENIPEEIDGCSGLFKSADCESACNYLLATDRQGKAFIKVNNRFIALKRTATSVTDEKTKERYEGEGFTITLEIYPLKQLGEELRQYKGELKLIKGDFKISETVIGEVGC